MKELSIEEKARRYDEAIEKAKSKIMDDKDHVLYENDVIEIFPELARSEDEKVKKAIFGMVYDSDNELWSSYDVSKSDVLAWLEKKAEPKEHDVCDNCEQQGNCISPCCIKLIEKNCEQKPAAMIQWNGENLREVVELTGLYKEGFAKWFHCDWDEYECYVHSHNNIFKLFNEDGSHYEVPIGAWIVKTPDGRNVASKAVFKNKSTEWSEEDEKLFKLSLENLTELKDRFGKDYGRVGDCIDWLKSLRSQATWMPSEKQMSMLRAIINEPNNIGSESCQLAMKSLYDDLSKLK